MKAFIQRAFRISAACALIAVSPVVMSDDAGDTDKQRVTAAQVAQGAGYWASQCQRCHNLRDPGEFTDDIWEVSVTHMRIRGNIPPEQIRAIKAFLKASN